MNIIEKQAQDYFTHALDSAKSYEEFCYKIIRCADKYYEGVYKIIYLEHILLLLKKQYDRHDLFCSMANLQKCRFKNLYENSLFYLTEHIKKLKQYLRKSELRELDIYNRLKFQDSEIIDIIRKNFIVEVNLVILKQEIEKLRELYFLDKKTWRCLLVGKIFHLIHSDNITSQKINGIIQISEIIYQKIFENSEQHMETYSKLKKSLTRLKLTA